MNNEKSKTLDDVIVEIRMVYKKVDALAVEMGESFVLSDKKIDALTSQMQEGFSLSDKKLEALAKNVDAKFDAFVISFDKKLDAKIDSLARMIQQGFSETAKHADLAALELRVVRLEKKAGLAAP